MASSDVASNDVVQKSLRSFHEDYDEGDEDSDYDSEEEADEMDAMQTLQMTRCDNGSISQDIRSGSAQTDGRFSSSEIINNLSSFGGG